jgi:hypothetical protein
MGKGIRLMLVATAMAHAAGCAPIYPVQIAPIGVYSHTNFSF